MDLGLLMKLGHVVASFWFMAGVIGRDYTFWRAGRVDSVLEVRGLLHASEFFERMGVILGGLFLGIFGLLVAWVRDWPLFGFLQGSDSNWLLVSVVLYMSGGLLIPALGLLKRRDRRTAALEHAVGIGRITPDLTEALNDKVVHRFRSSELVVLTVILILMVAKPF